MFFFRITKRKQLEKGRVKSRCGDEGAEEKEEKWVLQWRTEWQWTCERERASVEVVCSFSGAGSKAPERTPGIYRGRVECVKNMFFRFNGNTHLHGANPMSAQELVKLKMEEMAKGADVARTIFAWHAFRQARGTELTLINSKAAPGVCLNPIWYGMVWYVWYGMYGMVKQP